MLKGFVSGVEKDIVRIPMKGRNLFDKSAQAGQIYVTDSVLRYGVEIPVQAGTYTVSRGTSTSFAKTKIGDVYGEAISLNAARVFTLASDGYMLIYSSSQVAYDEAKDGIMLNAGSTPLPYEPYGYQEGWEVRDNQDRLIWGREDELQTATGTLPFKGYGLPLKSYEIEANMEQSASQQYSIAGTDSVTYQSDGTSIALQIVGNKTQTGTPTPSAPIQPEETGDRTAQLFDVNNIIDGGNFYPSNTYDSIVASSNTSILLIPCKPSTTYTISRKTWITKRFAMCFVTSSNLYDGMPMSGFAGSITDTGNLTATATSAADSKYMVIYYAKHGGSDSSTQSEIQSQLNELMVNEGRTGLTYEPYGYKLPISNGNTTYNAYLSEPLRKISDYADTISSDGTVTRRIKKLVLDGTENWDILSGKLCILRPSNCRQYSTCKSTHFVNTSSATNPGEMYVGGSYINFNYDGVNDDVAGFKTFLATQYSAGTPVTVWYVLANETTEQVTFPTITPTQGSNTLSVNTTLAPSAITLTATSGVWPKNPIEPEEFGEKTRNLADAHTITATWATADNELLAILNALPQGNYVLSYDITLTTRNNLNDASTYGVVISGVISDYLKSWGTSTVGTTRRVNHVITIGDNAGHISNMWIYGCGINGVGSTGAATISNIMLNTGSTALPYEPYGYKIPVTNAGTTYNIFLTEPLGKIGSYADVVNSDGTITRKVKKLVLTGTESWEKSLSTGAYYCSDAQFGATYLHRQILTTVCTHYKSVINATNTSGLSDGEMCLFASTPDTSLDTQEVYVKDNNIVDATAFKAYLAQQYVSGMPVTVWYVLHTSQTETVIAPEIATIAGANTLTVDTTLAPSETTIAGHIKDVD